MIGLILLYAAWFMSYRCDQSSRFVKGRWSAKVTEWNLEILAGCILALRLMVEFGDFGLYDALRPFKHLTITSIVFTHDITRPERVRERLLLIHGTKTILGCVEGLRAS